MRITVIGLGRFGTSLARELHNLGYEVTAIDPSERAVADIAEYVTLAVEGDGSDEELLRSLEVERSDIGVVAVGENLEVSMLSALLLERLGVPWVVAKATSWNHADLLKRIGVDRVIFPEIDAGIHLAHSITLRQETDYIFLTEAAGIAKIRLPARFAGSTAAALDREVGDVHVLLIVRAGQIIVFPGQDERLQPGDELLVVGHDDRLSALLGPGADAP